MLRRPVGSTAPPAPNSALLGENGATSHGVAREELTMSPPRVLGRTGPTWTRRGTVTVAALGLVVAAATGAAAYLNAVGGGTGQVSGQSTIDGVRVIGNASAVVLPGVSTPLSIRLLNSNAFPVRISEVSAVIATVDSADGTCSAADFAVTVPAGGPVTVPQKGIHGDGLASWPGGVIELRMSDEDQSDCLGSTVYLKYQAQ